MFDSIWLNANLATMRGERPYGSIPDGAIGIENGLIAWVGERSAIPGSPERLAHAVHDARGAWITPGLVDCHTHLVYAGDRADEFERRSKGATYEDIARAGGGIVSTVLATRSASQEELLASAAKRGAQWTREGATVMEIKSGYGLDRDTELKMLRVARQLSARVPLTVKATFLGAHALPEEFRGRAERYIEFVCGESMPAAVRERLVDAVDAYCERIGFTPEQVGRVFDAARRHGLPLKLHADQLSDLGGAALAARYGALSADHLEYTSPAGIEAMARAGTVAVVLPGAFYFLRETRKPPVEELRRRSVPIAIATDCNPGTSPLTSPLLALNLSCTLFRLTPEEALAGMTMHGARALGLQSSHGSLEAGKQADFALWDIERPAQLAYALGANPCLATVRGGEVVHRA